MKGTGASVVERSRSASVKAMAMYALKRDQRVGQCLGRVQEDTCVLFTLNRDRQRNVVGP